MSQLNQSGREKEFFLCLFYSGPPQIDWYSSTVWRTICISVSTESIANSLFWKHLHRHLEIIISWIFSILCPRRYHINLIIIAWDKTKQNFSKLTLKNICLIVAKAVKVVNGSFAKFMLLLFICILNHLSAMLAYPLSQLQEPEVIFSLQKSLFSYAPKWTFSSFNF